MFANFYGTKTFIANITVDSHWIISWARLIQSIHVSYFYRSVLFNIFPSLPGSTKLSFPCKFSFKALTHISPCVLYSTPMYPSCCNDPQNDVSNWYKTYPCRLLAILNIFYTKETSDCVTSNGVFQGKILNGCEKDDITNIYNEVITQYALHSVNRQIS